MKLLLTVVWIPALVLGQAGHWSGAVQVPEQEIKVEIDLVRDAGGAWAGAISIPVQNLKSMPLSAIKVERDSVAFALKGVPGDPVFTGKLAEDGKSIAGDFSQGGGAAPFKLTRTGDGKVNPPLKSTAIAKGLEGTWQGSLEAGGETLRLVVKLSNGADGATGSMISLDQGNAEFPISAIAQEKSHLKLDIPAIGAKYEGDWSANTITGKWSQGASIPFTLHR